MTFGFVTVIHEVFGFAVSLLCRVFVFLCLLFCSLFSFPSWNLGSHLWLSLPFLSHFSLLLPYYFSNLPTFPHLHCHMPLTSLLVLQSFKAWHLCFHSSRFPHWSQHAVSKMQIRSCFFLAWSLPWVPPGSQNKVQALCQIFLCHSMSPIFKIF